MINKIWGFLDGKKTYLSASVGLAHQGLKIAGIDVSEQNLSIAIDVASFILTAIFRKMAKK